MKAVSPQVLCAFFLAGLFSGNILLSFAQSSPNIEITSPALEEHLYAYKTYDIAWTPIEAHGPFTVIIQYCDKGGGATSVLRKKRSWNDCLEFTNDTAGETNSTTILWRTDSSRVSKKARILVSGFDLSESEISCTSSTFRLRYPEISISEPQAGDTLEQGSELAVNWSGWDNGSDSLRLYFIAFTGMSMTYSVGHDTVQNTGTASVTAPLRTNPASSFYLMMYSMTNSMIKGGIGPLWMRTVNWCVSDFSPVQAVFYRQDTIVASVECGSDIDSLRFTLVKTSDKTSRVLSKKQTVRVESSQYSRCSQSLVIPGETNPGADYKIYVYDHNRDLLLDSSQSFHVQERPDLRITEPTASSVWYKGTEQQVTWSSQGAIENVELALLLGDLIVYDTAIANSESFTIKLPADLNSGLGYRVRVSTAAPETLSILSDPFEITTKPEIGVTSPAGEELWLTGSQQKITWTSAGAIEDVAILLKRQSLPEWTMTIAASTANVHEYQWIIPEALETHDDYMIIVRSASDTTFSSTSGRLTISSPADANTPPAISAIPDQFGLPGTASPAISFQIDDAESDPANLILKAHSSNESIIQPDAVAFGGSGAQRTIIFTPQNDATGECDIAIWVHDPYDSAHISFKVTVTPPSAPRISSFSDTSFLLGIQSAAFSFTLTDEDTPIEELALSASSSDQTVIPDDSLSFSGSGAQRVLIAAFALNATGNTEISISVSDGRQTITSRFTITIFANAPPTIAALDDMHLLPNTSASRIPLIFSDSETPTDQLSVHITSSNTAIVPEDGISIINSAGQVMLELSPAVDQIGSTRIAVIVSDGIDSATTTFRLTVEPNKPKTIRCQSFVQFYTGDSLSLPVTISDEDSYSKETEVHVISMGQPFQDSQHIKVHNVYDSTWNIKIYAPTEAIGVYDFNITAADNVDTSSFQFYCNILPDAPVSRSIAAGASETATHELTWRPIGYSHNPRYKSPLQVLGQKAFDNTTWKLARWNTEASSYEFCNENNADAFSFAPGAMFWIITRKALTIAAPEGMGYEVDSVQRITIPAKGWHDFVLPFHLPQGIPFSAMRIASAISEEKFAVWQWKDSSRTLLDNPSTGQIPAEAICQLGNFYSINNISDNPISMWLPPKPAESAQSKNHTHSNYSASKDWYIKIGVTTENEKMSLSFGANSSMPLVDSIVHPAPPSLSGVIPSLAFCANKSNVAHYYRRTWPLDIKQTKLYLRNANKSSASFKISLDSYKLASDQNHSVYFLTEESVTVNDLCQGSIQGEIGPESLLSWEILAGPQNAIEAMITSRKTGPRIYWAKIANGIFFKSVHYNSQRMGVRVYDIRGRELASLSGLNHATWNRRQERPAAGAYLAIVTCVDIVTGLKTTKPFLLSLLK